MATCLETRLNALSSSYPGSIDTILAMTSLCYTQTPTPNTLSSSSPRSSIFYHYYKRQGHTKTQCAKLQYYSQNRHPSRSSIVSSSPHTTSIKVVTHDFSGDLTSQVAQVAHLDKQIHVMQYAMQSNTSSVTSTASGMFSSSCILDYWLSPKPSLY